MRLQHGRSRSNISPPTSAQFIVDPDLVRLSHSQTPPIMPHALSVGRNSCFQPMHELPTSAPYVPAQFHSSFDCPSNNVSDFEMFNYSNAAFTPVNAEMPPPQGSVDSLAKRHKYSYSLDSPATTTSDAYSPNTGPPTPYSPYMAMPLTPNSSVGSEDPIVRTAPKEQTLVYTPPDLRRMSVQSLINGLPGDDSRQYSAEAEQGRQYPHADSTSITYGYDMGFPDHDIPNNDDISAIAIFSPQSDAMDLDGSNAYGATEPRHKDMAFESGDYYAKPVAIRISKSLGPLPPMLMENQMNLLYFHHFLNHTARILVPHDCERNPFREILPESMYTSGRGTQSLY